MKTVAWFSAGVSSFVACHLLRQQIDDILFIDIADHHPDTSRFLAECEVVLGRKIGILRSPLGGVENACLARNAVRFVTGAPCTDLLKRRVRKHWERDQRDTLRYVWGMDYEEKHRADRIREAMPKQEHAFPLIDFMMSKQDAHGYAAKLGVKRPKMYDLGYNNNNCVGCVKGGMGYWNKIRQDFPSVFAARAALERRIGASVLKECYLDELDPDRGRGSAPIAEDCGIMCELSLG